MAAPYDLFKGASRCSPRRVGVGEWGGLVAGGRDYYVHAEDGVRILVL